MKIELKGKAYIGFSNRNPIYLIPDENFNDRKTIENIVLDQTKSVLPLVIPNVQVYDGLENRLREKGFNPTIIEAPYFSKGKVEAVLPHAKKIKIIIEIEE